jgi:SAM-dependent methyltransferase
MGKSGGIYHRRIALPNTLALLRLMRGERLLDLGAGQGVLAPHVARLGAEYLGVEASPRLACMARQRHGAAANVLVGDARSLPSEVVAGGFDAAVFLFSIQDMEPLESVMAETARALRIRGRVVLFMVHPCFRVPRQSGWGYDARRKLPVRRIDRYLSPLAVPMGRTTSYHRPLASYIEALAANGFAVDRLVEYPDDEAFARKQGRTVNAEIPLFLGMRAIKFASDFAQ